MAYFCNKNNKECDGCGDCRGHLQPCPECGNETYEALYLIGGTVIGCDECVERQWVL